MGLFSMLKGENYSYDGTGYWMYGAQNDESSFCEVKDGYLGNPHVNSIINRITKLVTSINITNDDRITKELRFKVITDWLIHGNVYLYERVTAVGFKTTSLLRIDPRKVQIDILDDGSHRYSYYNIADRQIFIDDKEVGKSFHHFKNYNPNSEYIGISPMTPIQNTILRTNEGKIAGVAMMINGAPAGVMSVDAINATPDEIDRMAKQFQKDWRGGDKKGKISFSSIPTKFEKIGMSNADLQIIETEAADLHDICRIYGYPATLLMNDASTYNNIKEAKSELWTQTVQPLGELESLFYNSIGIQAEFNTEGVKELQTNYAEQSDRIISEYQAGLITLNEARKLLGYKENNNIQSQDGGEKEQGV